MENKEVKLSATRFMRLVIARVTLVESVLRYRILPIYIELRWTTDQKYEKWQIFGSREFLAGASK